MTTASDELSNVLRDVFIRNLESYKRILTIQPGVSHHESSREEETLFWDIVVITAGNSLQRESYLQRVNDKIAKGQIPKQARYHVIEDPPESKIGSGGSTFRVMKVLQEQYSTEFLQNANNPEGIQVLELKLALYLHLLPSMPPGVLLTSADGIELFYSKTPFPSEPKPFTITALAHPSSLEIGSQHGVYLLDDPNSFALADFERPAKARASLLLSCRQFLHKPSIGQLRIPTFHISSKTAVLSIAPQIYPELRPQCDLEAWADVLCFPKGRTSTSDPDSPELKTTLKEDLPSDPHQHGRELVRQAFDRAGVSVEVMVLNSSKFYHLGTMKEFLEAVCIDQAFMSELNIVHTNPGLACVGENEEVAKAYPKSSIDTPCYLEHSALQSSIALHSDGVKTTIGPWTLIADTDLPQGAIVPKNTCMFTLQIPPSTNHSTCSRGGFVTFSFSVLDDMKRSAALFPANCTSVATPMRDSETLCIFERVPVYRILPSAFNERKGEEDPVQLGLDQHDNQANEKIASLWTGPFFEVAKSKRESIQLALDRLVRVQECLTFQKGTVNSISPTQSRHCSATKIVGWISLKDAARIADMGKEQD
ncbi:hypothetical protein BGW38_009755 [Lunasporangiospora selenospora]|uniref:GDP-fucose pyrophosphorylase domain-containing protein n=1 Tax=Lunasporangiospora selenospora TaxID=979761 RepID=A0A9P6FY87_9FUNG|nr:hypothetical protein BGW38_009755 [Lunasporangiospora selenospora]